MSIAAGGWGTMAIDDKGEAWAWGLNNYHQLGVPRKCVGDAELQCCKGASLSALLFLTHRFPCFLGPRRREAEAADAETNCVYAPKRAKRWDGLVGRGN